MCCYVVIPDIATPHFVGQVGTVSVMDRRSHGSVASEEHPTCGRRQIPPCGQGSATRGQGSATRGQGSATRERRQPHVGKGRPRARASRGMPRGQDFGQGWAVTLRGVSRATQPRRQPVRRVVLAARGVQDRRDGGSIFILDDVCMAWLMNALSEAPALSDEQLHRARQRLAQY
jgi:hypothetical protein